MRLAHGRAIRRLVTPLAAALATALATACGRDGGDGGPLAPVPEARPSLDVRDTRSGAAPGFWFLPPIAPTLTAYPGTFDGTRAPTVEVCRWSGTACVGAPIATFSRAGGTVTVDATAQLYRADWPTTGLAAGALHRIRILDAGAELGHADAKVPGDGETAAGLTAQGIVPLGNVSRLAIRFRLERNTAPGVTIVSPPEGTVLPAGTPVTLAGTATDAEEGDVTPHLVWRTDRLPGELGTGGSLTVQLPGGRNTVSASVTDANGATTTATRVVVVSVVTLPASLNVPYGGTASLPITIAEPAPPGGLTLSVTSSAPGHVGLSATSVTIPAGTQSANVTLQGVLPGPSTITATNVGYGTATSQVATTASLDVRQQAVTFATGRTESITVALQSAGADIAAPPGGVPVALTSSNPSCVSATAPPAIAAGFVTTAATLSYGGSAPLPCTATVTASAPGTPAILTDAVSVTVNPAPTLSFNMVGVRVGAGLRVGRYAVTLAAPAPAGGVSIALASADGAALRVSGDDVAAVGATSVTLTVPERGSSAAFYLHGIEGHTGPVALTASATGYAGAATTVTVVAPAVELTGLPSTTTSLSPNAPFQVRLGATTATGAFHEEQPVRPGAAPVTATVTNGAAAVGQLVTTALTGQSVAVTIAPGQSRSAATTANGGVAFDPLGSGASTVAASAPGFVATPYASQAITVSAPTISIGSYGVRVGGGLRAGPYGISLGAPAGAGGVTVTLASSDGATLRVSDNGTASVGGPSATITVPQGQTSASFYLHGVEGQTGSATITASAPGYTTATSPATVVQPALALIDLPTSTNTLAADLPFRVRVGAPNALGSAIQEEQPVRPGGAAITATVTNGSAAVGQLRTAAGAAQSVTVTIAPGQSASPSTVAAGGVALDPLGSGSTTVAASAAGLVAVPAASHTIAVSAPTLALMNAVRVGSGLRSGTFSVFLGAPAPAGGVSVALASADPAVLRVSDGNASSVGAGSVVLAVPQGQTSASFHAHGMEGRSGTVALTATAPGYATGTSTVAVLPATIEIVGLSPTTTTLSPDLPFRIHVGLPSPGSGPFDEQPVRPGGTPITATVTNGSGLVAQLRTSAGAAQSATLTIGVGQAGTPSTVAAGGVAFDPLGSGTTTVAVSAPGLTALPGASQAVTVGAPALTVGASGARVGSGLRSGTYAVILGAPAPAGGVALTLASSNGAVLRVSGTDAAAVGAPSAVITVPQGQTQASFYVHGVEGQTGSVTVTASAPGYTNGSASLTVVPPAIELLGLATSRQAAAPDAPFQVRVGVAPVGGSLVFEEQAVRPGAAPLTATLTNGAAAVARLVTSALAGQSVTVTVAPGQARSPATVAAGGVAFDALAAGTTTVSASAPGVTALPTASVPVTVVP